MWVLTVKNFNGKVCMSTVYNTVMRAFEEHNVQQLMHSHNKYIVVGLDWGDTNERIEYGHNIMKAIKHPERVQTTARL